jgi:hypothetical protein
MEQVDDWATHRPSESSLLKTAAPDLFCGLGLRRRLIHRFTRSFLNPDRSLVHLIRKERWMKTLSLLVVCSAGLFLAGCDFDTGIKGSGRVVTVQQPVGPFTEISGRGALRIEWRSGEPSLSIATDDNLIGHFEARTTGNRLELRMRERVRPTHGIKLVITSPSLKGAKLSGAAELVAHGVTGQTFAVESTGAASITLDGTVEDLLADMTGASELKAKGLQAKVVEISTTGAADAWVNVTEKLRVAITGAGDVTYSGNPPTIERKITGAGTIHHKD